MRIEDSFEVPLPAGEAWALLMDVERIAPCLPGAQLREVEGDTYRGLVKVKVGPITAQYQGSARFEARDDAARTARVQAAGRETRGQGNASATIELAAAPTGDGGRTRVEVRTDLTLTGRVAQLGRGALTEVSSKLLAQFVRNLEAELVAGAPPPAPDGLAPAGPSAAPGAPGVAPAGPGTAPAAVAEDVPEARPGDGSQVASAPTGPRRVEHPEPEPVDLVRVGAGPVARRLWPLAAAVLAAWLVRRLVRRRRRRRS
jgi:carbon monoxide dehydrogenase subunit G